MTLKRQLWIGIIGLSFFSFVGSLLVSNLSAREHLREQLLQKNIDNANSLALTLSNSAADAVTRELLLSAQFDTGHYQYIRLEGVEEPLSLGVLEAPLPQGVPHWFVKVFPIEPEPGVAQLSDGWRSAGTLRLASERRFAYIALWKNTKRLCGYFALAALVFGLAGSVLLRWITEPLYAVVAQARAIGERRFIQIAEPRIHEFKTLGRAMNQLSGRVQQMLTEESARLADRHRDHSIDPVSGLLQRDPFMERLASLLKREDDSSEGTVVILRIMNLTELNRRHGRAILDRVLGQIGSRLRLELEQHEGMFAGRLNGSEFGIVAPCGPDPGELALGLRTALITACRDCSIESPAVAAGATHYRFPDALPQLLQRTDQALAAAEQSESGGIEVAEATMQLTQNSQDEIAQWSRELDRAFSGDHFQLQTFPVYGRSGSLLHWEAPSRLQTETGELISAARFMPWVARMGRMPELDLVVLRVAQKHVERSGSALGINLSARILEDTEALTQLIRQVGSAPTTAPMLWLEVPENGVYARLEGFRRLCNALKPMGCRIGIEHAGPLASQMGALFDMGLDYVKLDASLIRNIGENRGNQAFVQGFCTIVHAIGLCAIAEGVESESEWEALLALGIDAGTGRYFASLEATASE